MNKGSVVAASILTEIKDVRSAAGIVKEPEIEAVVADELEKIETQCRTEEKISSPVDLLARGLLLSMGGSNAADGRLEKALREYIHLHGGHTPSRAGGEQLSDGRFCRSCMSSLDSDENRGNSEVLCRWCSDSEGKLLPRDRVLEIMTHRFSSWQPGITLKEAGRRADLYSDPCLHGLNQTDSATVRMISKPVRTLHAYTRTLRNFVSPEFQARSDNEENKDSGHNIGSELFRDIYPGAL